MKANNMVKMVKTGAKLYDTHSKKAAKALREQRRNPTKRMVIVEGC